MPSITPIPIARATSTQSALTAYHLGPISLAPGTYSGPVGFFHVVGAYALNTKTP